MKRAFIFLIGFTCPTLLAAQNNLTQTPDPDPQVQQAALHVAEGFEISLFAADPMIDPPIQMAWDESGRLWVATSTSYPQPVPGQAINDKIFVLEDTDGDGQADQTSMFADGLLTPTGIAFGDGGVYVANSTEILHLKDTDGDGQADERRVVLSGFGADDTHHLIHTFRWGPDGLFYLNQSVYIYSHIETPWGVRRLRGGGIWQFNTQTLELDVLARGLWNSWGLDFDDWGQTFATDGAGFQGLHFIYPDVAYAPAYGVDRVLQGMNMDHPKYAGLALISNRHFPDDWQGNLITNDYRANRVKRFTLIEDASGFRAEEQEDLIWTDHVAFRPVDVNVGPDGALYFADWYNPIIQHGEVDFRDPRRDHKHGRIWRVTAKDRPLVTPPLLAEAPVETLLVALEAPEDWTRRQAKRLLKERGPDAVQPSLERWVRDLPLDDPSATHHRLEALWTYQALGLIETDLLKTLLTDADHRARAAAVRVLMHWNEQVAEADALLAEAVRDDHPRVRREAVTALGRRASAEAARHALSVAVQPMDTYLDYALWHTMRELAPYWLPQLEADPNFFGAEISPVLFALQAVDDPTATTLLMQRYQKGEVPEDHTAAVLQTLTKQGGPEELQTLYAFALQGKTIGANGQAAHLQALETAATDYNAAPPTDAARIATLLDAEKEDVRRLAALLAGRWHITTSRNRLQTIAEEGATPEAVQQAALQGLAAMGAEEDIQYLTDFAQSSQRAHVRMYAIQQLITLDLPTAAMVATTVLQDLSPDTYSAALFDAFFRQDGGIDALAEAVHAQPIPTAMAQAGLDHIQRRGKRFDLIRDAFVASGAVITPARMNLDLSMYDLQRLEYEMKGRGDPARGEALYRRASLLCTNCHAIGGAGGRVGPDLSSIGVTAPADYLIEALLAPEQAVKDGYAMARVVKQDGSVVHGILAQETGTALIIHDAADRTITVPLAQVQQREVLPGSIMPAGLTASLTRDEFIDLMAFLSALGEEGPFRVSRAEQVRRWQRLADTEAARNALAQQGSDFSAARPDDLTWQPAYSTVAGTLPLDELPILTTGNQRYSFVAFDLDVQENGTFVLGFENPEGLMIWLDGEAGTTATPQLTIEAAKGVHRIAVAIDRSVRPDAPLKITLEKDGTTGRAVFVGGK